MLKILSAGLIAAAAFATPAMARESHANEWSSTGQGYTRPFEIGHGHMRMAAPSVSAYPETPTDQPGGVCDHGDNPQIC